MKKIFAILLSLALMLSLAVPAMADDATPGPYTITIDNSVEGYTYAAYQIFTGDLQVKATDNVAGNQTTSVLSNIQWGNGISEAGKTALYAKYNLTAEADKTAAKVAEALATAKDVTAFAEIAGQHLTAKESGTFSAANGYEISGLNPGYYLVKNTGVPSTEEGTFYTEYIVEVVEDSTVSPKGTVPSVEKKVKDTNDTTGITTDWQDSADHDIGDVVSFKLTATLPNNYSAYERYKLTFVDTFEHFKDITITSVYLADTQGNAVANATFAENETNGYTKQIGTNSFTVTFANLKTSSIAAQIKDSYKVVVEYTAVLSDDATLGATGNPNKVYLKYSNNPNWNGSGEPGTPGTPEEPTGKTPEDKVIVFTYKTIINKVDGNQAPLSGAEFTLYKEVAPIAENTYPTGAAIKAALATKNSSIKADALKDDAKYIIINAVGTDGDTFEFKGIDDGTYVLVETTIPAGYNAWEAVEFKVEAEHDEEADEPKLISLTAGDLVTGEVDSATGKETKERDFKDTGIIETNIENRSGTVLPETGGMGTTIFYAVGGVMVAAAAILLITKKRMSAEG